MSFVFSTTLYSPVATAHCTRRNCFIVTIPIANQILVQIQNLIKLISLFLFYIFQKNTTLNVNTDASYYGSHNCCDA